MDKILINNMKFRGMHGCTTFEKNNAQLFIINLELGLDLSISMENDNIADTVDYSLVYLLVKNIVENESFNLLEKLANVIINKIFEQFSLDLVKIHIKKPNPPIKGEFDYVGVEIERENEK